MTTCVQIRPHRLVVRTSLFQGGSGDSISPGGKIKSWYSFFNKPKIHSPRFTKKPGINSSLNLELILPPRVDARAVNGDGL